MKRVLFLLAFALSAQAAPIDVVRQNFIDSYTAAGSDRSGSRVAGALRDLEAQARSFSSPGFLLGNGKWSDINYDDTPDGAWSPWDHSRRLLVLARAYKTPGQPLHRDPVLRAQIESALAAVPSYYGVTRLPLGNWWFWTIGAPLDLGPTLVLMQDDIDKAVFDECVRTLAFHIGSSPTARGLVGPVPVGENLVWSSFTHLCLSIVRRDETMLAAVSNAVSTVAMPAIGDGVQADWSFHQHGPQLYTGGYGGAFANSVAQLVLLLRNTTYSIKPAALAAFTDYLLDGVTWSLYQKYFDVSIVGRDVANRNSSAYHGVAALLQAAQFATYRGVEVRAAAAAVSAAWSGPLPLDLAGLNVAATPSLPSGHRHFFKSDYTVHRRPGWFASVKMLSSRTKSGESTNGENVLGSRQSDGRFYLVVDGDEYFANNVWPALDWSRLPGTTVEKKATTADASYGFGTRAFAGGTGDGTNGVSAMDFAPLASSVTAKKSWFFFDDVMVFITSDIRSLSSNRVETIVDQRPSTSPHVHYHFYGQMPRRETVTRTGTWASLGGSQDATPHTKTFDTIWFDHGAQPAGASVEYAISPAGPIAVPPTIIANNASAAAVRSGNMTGIVFWTAGKVAGVESDAPAIVFMTQNEIFITDPTNGTGKFRITIGKATFEVDRNGGRTWRGLLLPPGKQKIKSF